MNKILLVLLIPMLLLIGKDNKYKKLYESLNKLSNEKLMHHIMITSKNYQGDYDINVLVPLDILKTRKNESVELLGNAIFEEAKYNKKIRILIIRILEEIHTNEVVPFLKQASNLPDSDISVPASRALSEFNDFTADTLIEQLNKVMNDDRKRYKVLKGFMAASYRKLRGNDIACRKAYEALLPIVLDENMEIHSRQYALISMAGLNIQDKEILDFCKKTIIDEKEDPILRTSAIAVISRFKRIDFLDLIYETIVKSTNMEVVRAGLRQFTEYQHPKADKKIDQFKKLIQDEEYIKNKQIKVTKYYSSKSVRKSENRGLSERAYRRSKNILKSYKGYIEDAESNTERMNNGGIKIP